MHRCLAWDRRTDRWTDGSQHRLEPQQSTVGADSFNTLQLHRYKEQYILWLLKDSSRLSVAAKMSHQ